MNASSPTMNFAIDAGYSVGAIVVPLWVYQTSIVAGMVTALLSVVVMTFRAMIAIRAWRTKKDDQ